VPRFGAGLAIWVIVLRLSPYEFCTSLQNTSIKALVCADVTEEQSSSASTTASTIQQMSISFGGAVAYDGDSVSQYKVLPTMLAPNRREQDDEQSNDHRVR